MCSFFLSNNYYYSNDVSSLYVTCVCIYIYKCVINVYIYIDKFVCVGVYANDTIRYFNLIIAQCMTMFHVT